MATNDITGLQMQLAELRRRAEGNARSGWGYDRDLQNRIDSTMNQLNQANAKGGGAGGKSAEEIAKEDAKKWRQKQLDLTEGRGDAAMNDAMVNAAMGRLDRVSSGQDAPFTREVVNQQLADQAGSSASAMEGQAENLRMQAAGLGMSPSDPAFQAKMRQFNANRQSTNLSAQGNLMTNAQLQNFGARQTGTNALLSNRMGQHSLANAMYSQGAGAYGGFEASTGHQSLTQPFIYNFGQTQTRPAQATGGQTAAPPIQYDQYRPGGTQTVKTVQTNQGPMPAQATQMRPVLHTNNQGYVQPGRTIVAQRSGTTPVNLYDYRPR